MADRYVEVYKDGDFCRMEFEELKKGDVFKLYEGDTIVCHPDGGCLMEAASDAYLDPAGTWTVVVDPVNG